MRLGVVLVVLGALLGAPRAGATPRWELEAKIERSDYLDGQIPLADGRVLVCLEKDGRERCAAIDPLSGAGDEVPISYRAGAFASALSLDDGSLLLPHEHALLDVSSGKKRALPQSPRRLSDLRGVALSGGRAAFVTSARCDRVLFYFGFEAGFRDVVVAPAGTCVQEVFDLKDGRVLIARTTETPERSGYHLDLVAFDLRSLRFERGPRLFHRNALAAFVHRGEIVVLVSGYERTADGGTRSEALFIDRNMKQRQLFVFEQGDLGRKAARADADHFLIFDRRGSLLWDPTRGTLARIPFPGRSSSDFFVLRRSDTLVAFFPQSRQVFSLARTPPQSACAEVVTYAANSVSDRRAGAESERIDALLSPADVETCRDHVERARRFPESIQAPLEALLLRREGTAGVEEQVAARVLCTLLPKLGVPLITRITAAGHLDGESAKLCNEAREVLPVIAAAGTPALARVVARQGLQEAAGRTLVRYEVQRLLERRRDLASHAFLLLREAREQKAEGYDMLHAALCTSDASGELERACDAAGPERERDFRPPRKNEDRPRLLLNLGIATGVLGGLTTLAYVDRDGDGGRAIAIGSGILGGATLGAVGTFALSEPKPDLEGLGTLLLAAAVGAGGAIAGGVIATHTSRKPGDGRFATAAVPLSAMWLTGVAITVDAW